MGYQYSFKVVKRKGNFSKIVICNKFTQVVDVIGIIKGKNVIVDFRKVGVWVGKNARISRSLMKILIVERNIVIDGVDK